MKKILSNAHRFALAIAFVAMVSSCQKNMNDNSNVSSSIKETRTNDSKEIKNFVQVNLVGDNSEYNPSFIDPGLINPWGIAFPASGPFMVAGTGVGKCFTLDGTEGAPLVNIPIRSGGSGLSHPSGVVVNPTSNFILPNGNPAKFIFASTDGTITGWNIGSSAVKMKDGSASNNYMGLAMAAAGEHQFLYVANFSQNKIDVYDDNWNQVTDKLFTDPNIPDGYAPFNVQLINTKLYVTYAKKNSITGEEETGPGKGYVNIFNSDGSLFRRFAAQGKLDAPWGIVRAPAGFWGSASQFGDMILVGNFGDGHINVFDEDGNFVGPLALKGKAVEIDGLWGLAFPPSSGFNSTYLYFAAGPHDETHGLFGYIKNLYLN